MGRGVAQAQQGRASEPAGRAAALCHARVTLDDDNRRWVGLHPDGPFKRYYSTILIRYILVATKVRECIP